MERDRSSSSTFFPPAPPTRVALSEKKPYFEVIGAWTKAGIASCIHIKSSSDDILLDCGVNEASTFSAKIVLISHGHIDHAGCCLNHARGKALSTAPSTYFIPEAIYEPMMQAKAAYEQMDGHEIPMKLVVIAPGQSAQISNHVRILPFKTEHRVPSQGYAIFKKWKGQVLSQYGSLSHNELAKLEKSGVKVFEDSFETLEVVYTGDTLFNALLDPENLFLFQAKLFFIEVTYIDGSREKAQERFHVHLEDVTDHVDRFQNIQTLVIVHLSQRYSFNRVIEILRSQLPSNLANKCKISLRSFGANEHLTLVNNPNWSYAQRVVPGWGWSDNRSQRNFGPASGQSFKRGSQGFY